MSLEYIDSDYRISGTSSDFLYQLDLKSTDSVCVISANIPKSYYLIQSIGNTVIFTENSTVRTITISPGNYSVGDFLGQLVVLLNPGTVTYTDTIDKVTQITTYAAVGGSPPTLTYTIKFNKFTSIITYIAIGGVFNSITFPSDSSIYRQMGFNYNTVNVSSGNQLISPNVPLFQLTNIVFIRSNIQQSDRSILGGNILQSISAVNQPNMYSVTYQNTTYPNLVRKRYMQNSIIHIWVTDSDGFILDLNGLPINIELLFFNYDNSAEILRTSTYLDQVERAAKKPVTST